MGWLFQFQAGRALSHPLTSQCPNQAALQLEHTLLCAPGDGGCCSLWAQQMPHWHLTRNPGKAISIPGTSWLSVTLFYFFHSALPQVGLGRCFLGTLKAV